jgi:hypothetical protein
MSSMGIHGPRKPQTTQYTAPKPQAPASGQGQKPPNLSAMYSQVAQQSMKTKPHH